MVNMNTKISIKFTHLTIPETIDPYNRKKSREKRNQIFSLIQAVTHIFSHIEHDKCRICRRFFLPVWQHIHHVCVTAAKSALVLQQLTGENKTLRLHQLQSNLGQLWIVLYTLVYMYLFSCARQLRSKESEGDRRNII